MEDSKEGINLNLTTKNHENGEQKPAKHNCNEANNTSLNTCHTLVKTESISPVELSRLPEFVQIQESKDFGNSGMLTSVKCEPVGSIITPQGLWRKRHEANQRGNLAAKGSPSRFASLYKTRMPSPSPSRAKEHRGSSEARSSWLNRGSSEARSSWLMSARNIRMQTAGDGQNSHFRSLSQCNARNRNEEFNGILRRPRRSLDSVASTAYQFQGSMYSSPNASCSSLYTTLPPPLDVGDPFTAQNISYFEVQPKFESYQLVGDSLFVRFAEQLLDIPCGTVEGSRGIGLCVSGQKSGDLLRRVSQRLYPVTEKIVLLIGTNDVLQNIHPDVMCYTLRRLLEQLKKYVSRIVLLTLPPIPKLQRQGEHWEKMHVYNNFIRSLQDDVVSVADIHHLYVTENQGCRMEMFERYYGDGQRVDLIHLNRNGLGEIHKYLLQNNFVN